MRRNAGIVALRCLNADADVDVFMIDDQELSWIRESREHFSFPVVVKLEYLHLFVFCADNQPIFRLTQAVDAVFIVLEQWLGRILRIVIEDVDPVRPRLFVLIMERNLIAPGQR